MQQHGPAFDNKETTKAHDFLECRIIDYTEAYCLCTEKIMAPTTENLTGFVREFLHNTIQSGIRINYTRAIIIMTECEDFKGFRMDEPQKLIFGIPLMAANTKTGALDSRCFTAGQAVSCGWVEPSQDDAGLSERIDLIRQEFD